MIYMPAECWAERCLLPSAISGKPVWSECPSQRPLLPADTAQSYKHIQQCGQEGQNKHACPYLAREMLAGKSNFAFRSWSPSGTCRSRQHKAQNTYRSVVRKHMEYMPAESRAERCLLPSAISGEPVWSECPSQRPLLPQPFALRKALR
jgi:hypothetical protein